MVPDWTPIWGQQQREAKSRTDVLKPLVWPLGITASAVPALLAAKAPLWMPISAGSAFCVLLIVYIIAYITLLIFRPDYLRSENYELTKMAIQNGLLGDSKSGMATIHTPAITVQPSVKNADSETSKS